MEFREGGNCQEKHRRNYEKSVDFGQYLLNSENIDNVNKCLTEALGQQ